MYIKWFIIFFIFLSSCIGQDTGFRIVKIKDSVDPYSLKFWDENNFEGIEVNERKNRKLNYEIIDDKIKTNLYFYLSEDVTYSGEYIFKGDSVLLFIKYKPKPITVGEECECVELYQLSYTIKLEEPVREENYRVFFGNFKEWN